MWRKMSLIISRALQVSKRRSRQVAPEGFFSVHVGSDKERFVVNVTCLNHPLFRLLLEDAESEFGFCAGDGPLVLPCHVDLFHRVLAEMETRGGGDGLVTSSPVCGFGCSPARRSGSYRVLAAPSRTLVMKRY